MLDAGSVAEGGTHVVTELVDRAFDRFDLVFQISDTLVGLGFGTSHGGVDLVVDDPVGLALVDRALESIDHASGIQVLVELDVVALAQPGGFGRIIVGPLPDLVIGHRVGGHFGVPALFCAGSSFLDTLAVSLIAAQLRFELHLQRVGFGEILRQDQLVELRLHLVGQGDLGVAGEGEGGGEDDSEEDGDTNQIGLHVKLLLLGFCPGLNSTHRGH